MTLSFKGPSIRSDRSTHRARRLPGSSYWWEVSYLPGSYMNYEDVVTAMEFADDAGREHFSEILATWAGLERWGDELNLTAGDVLDRLHHDPAWPSGERNPSEQRNAHPDDVVYDFARRRGKKAEQEIGRDTLTSDRTSQSARRLHPGSDDWEVSFLPGRVLSEKDAFITVLIADEAGNGAELADVGGEGASDLLSTWARLDAWGDRVGVRAWDLEVCLHDILP